MHILLYVYFISVLLLTVYGLHRTSMLLRLKLNPYRQPKCPKIDQLPTVCVQIPLYNEPDVAARIINAVSKFDYPNQLFEIQVLDDSTDETVGIVNSEVEKLTKDGVNVEVIRRKVRENYKAGALANGLKQTKAEFIAIFDADFIPSKDFLTKTVPYFIDPKVAFVQTRWEHLNRDYNLLTRAQALLIDGHFIIEHASRFCSSFFNFNGTAGIWRKSAIDNAGGWQGDTITEDLDLSYRARLSGYKAIYLRDVLCLSELPETIVAFKSQQFRWMKGSAQVFKKLIKSILRSKLKKIDKIEAFFHLSANFCYVLMFIAGLLLVPVAAYRSKIYFSIGAWFELFVFFSTFVSLCIFYIFSQTQQGRKVNVLELVSAICLGIGMSAHCSCASISGLRSAVGEFVRTPKTGSLGMQKDMKKSWFKFDCIKNLVFLKHHKKELIISLYFMIALYYVVCCVSLMTAPFVMLILSGYTLILIFALNSNSYFNKKYEFKSLFS